MFILGTSSLAEYAAAPRPASTTFTPALAKMLCMAARAAHDVGVPVGIAGRYASRLELLPFYLGLGISHIAVYSYQTLRLRLEMARLCSGTLRPRFDPLLYSRVMHLFSGHELTELLSELSLQGITPAPRAGGAG